MISANSELVLNFLKRNFGKEFSKQEIAHELGISISAVTGSINSFVKKGYARNTREEVIEKTPATETRKASISKVVYHTLTEDGLAYDPVAEEAERVAAIAAKKAQKVNE